VREILEALENLPRVLQNNQGLVSPNMTRRQLSDARQYQVSEKKQR